MISEVLSKPNHSLTLILFECQCVHKWIHRDKRDSVTMSKTSPLPFTTTFPAEGITLWVWIKRWQMMLDVQHPQLSESMTPEMSCVGVWCWQWGEETVFLLILPYLLSPAAFPHFQKLQQACWSAAFLKQLQRVPHLFCHDSSAVFLDAT